MQDQGCEKNGNFSMIVHGFEGSINSSWIGEIVTSLIKNRAGCVVVIDYSVYANVSNYFSLVSHYFGISAVLTKKVRQIGHYGHQYFFCHSFGSRICVQAGSNVGRQRIDRMDLCDPAAVGFDGFLQGLLGFVRDRNPKLGAKNVACIDTSTFFGTQKYNCHQNFRMGNCFTQQPSSKSLSHSHSLCTLYYRSSFENKIAPNNYWNCTSRRMAKFSPSDDVRLGLLGDFDRTKVRGDIFIATAEKPPFIVVNGIIKNDPPENGILIDQYLSWMEEAEIFIDAVNELKV